MQAYDTYETLLNDAGDGTPRDAESPQLARELARMDLTLNYYTQWYWKIDLQNLFHFLSLRIDPHAQYEIRVYAQIMAEIAKAWCPLAWGAFEDYRVQGKFFSGVEMTIVQKALAGEPIDALIAGATELSARERAELRDKLGLPR